MKIIPSNPQTNRGEMKVLEKLKNCKDDRFKNWIVYHSLNYPVVVEKSKKLSYKYFGEADFVFLIPDKGVINVEVKGGDIFCKDGEWYSKELSGKIEKLGKSPLKQASDSKYNLRKNFENKLGKKIPQEYLLIFTKTSIEQIGDTLEISKENIIDRDDFTLNFFEKLFKLSNNLKPGGGILSLEDKDIDILKKFIRPNFDNYIKTSSLLKESDIEIHKFTSEQIRILDYLEENKRLLIDGSQGTGKSVMAEEILRRKSEDKNKKILFLNSTKLIVENLKKKYQDYSNIKIRTFSMFLMDINREVVNFYRSNDFNAKHEEWIENSIQIIDNYEKKWIQENFQFDIIIFDEMQNVCSFKNFYNFLNRILKGNLINGEYYFFGDFRYQKFFGNDNSIALENSPSNNLLDFKEHTLIQNVRNSKSISQYAPIISGLFKKYPYEISKNEIGKVEPFFLKNKTEKVKKLEEILIKLHNDGVRGQDITILSDFNLGHKKNYLNEVDVSSYYQIVDLSKLKDIGSSLKEIQKKKETIFFSTTSGFQGMENKIIIYLEPLSHDFFTDIGSSAKPEMLAFNAMGRAQTFLYILWDATHENSYSKKMSLLGSLIS